MHSSTLDEGRTWTEIFLGWSTGHAVHQHTFLSAAAALGRSRLCLAVVSRTPCGRPPSWGRAARCVFRRSMEPSGLAAPGTRAIPADIAPCGIVSERTASAANTALRALSPAGLAPGLWHPAPPVHPRQPRTRRQCASSGARPRPRAPCRACLLCACARAQRPPPAAPPARMQRCQGNPAMIHLLGVPELCTRACAATTPLARYVLAMSPSRVAQADAKATEGAGLRGRWQ